MPIYTPTGEILKINDDCLELRYNGLLRCWISFAKTALI